MSGEDAENAATGYLLIREGYGGCYGLLLFSLTNFFSVLFVAGLCYAAERPLYYSLAMHPLFWAGIQVIYIACGGSGPGLVATLLRRSDDWILTGIKGDELAVGVRDASNRAKRPMRTFALASVCLYVAIEASRSPSINQLDSITFVTLSMWFAGLTFSLVIFGPDLSLPGTLGSAFLTRRNLIWSLSGKDIAEIGDEVPNWVIPLPGITAVLAGLVGIVFPFCLLGLMHYQVRFLGRPA